MNKRLSSRPALLLAGVCALTLIGGIAAADAQMRTPAQDQIYGSQMMTQQERNEYRDRMRSAETAAQREQIRNEHHEQMQARAKERGITLPDDPPAQGMGQGLGRGMGAGSGMGQGMGMGQGQGGGRR